MSQFSKIITALPIVFGLLFLSVDYLFDDFAITEEMVKLFEFMIGGTIFGGVANAGFKRYTAYKTKSTSH